MDAKTSTESFQRADRLYREGRYREALDLLSELNSAYPNAKNVLYPAALCMEKLGQGEEALAICEQLIRQFKDPRAEELRARLMQPTPPSLDGLDALGLPGAGDILDDAPRRDMPTWTMASSGGSTC